MFIDLHTHSSISDGTDSPTRLVMRAAGVGLDVISLTDHDTFDGLEEAHAAGGRFGVKVLPGIEITCREKDVDVHLLGYGCHPDDVQLGAELERTRASRLGRLHRICQKLTDLDMPLTVEEVMRYAGTAHSLGRPHVADAMIAKGYVKDRDEAFATWLSHDCPAYVRRYSIDLADAITLVRQAKGVAVLAHPWARGADRVLSPERIAGLAADGLEGIEVDHNEHGVQVRRMLFDLGGRLGLIRTGSSDYHGTGKKGHELGCNTTRETAYREICTRVQLRGGHLMW